jgi:hypothetical protein
MRQRGMTAVAAVLVLLNLALVGLTMWRIWAVQHTDQPTPSATSVITDGQSQTSTAARNGFSMTFPAGWNGVLRPQDRDAFFVPGKSQPGGNDQVRANVKDITTYDCQSGCVFEAAIGDNFAAPQGDANDFIIGSGNQLLSGRKYVYIYGGNDVNATRTNGDKDYTYTFSLGGKRELRVVYRVFADDPADQHDSIESIIKTIRRR